MRKLHSFDRAKNTALSNQLKALRKAMGLTQKDLASDMNVSDSYYAHLENHPASMSIDTLMKVSNALKTSVFELIACMVPIETRNEVMLMARMLGESMRPGVIIKGFLTITSKTDKENA